MITALVLYAATMLAVGLLSARPASRSGDSFILASRSLGLLPTWAALSCTTIGGTTTLVLSSLVAVKGVPGIWLALSGSIGLLCLGAFLAARLRETNAVTLPEVIGRAYGQPVRRVASILVIMAEVVWFALLTQATEAVITAATNWNSQAVLAVTTAVFVVYTAFGGQRAVIRTDMIQFALMAGGLLFIALPAALASLARTGWPSNLIHFPTGPAFTLLDIAAMLVLTGLPHMAGSDVWSKLLSARDESVARKAALGAAVTKTVFAAAVTVIALAGVSRGYGEKAVSLFPLTVIELAGPLLAPLLLTVMVATMHSSADSVLLSAAAVTGHDVLNGRTSPHFIRAFVVLYGVLGLLVALFMRDVVETFRLGYTLFASGLILPALISFSKRFRVAPCVAAAAMVGGGASSLVMTLLPFKGVEPVLFGTCVNALILLSGLCSGRRD